jgi:copper chaperone CopZ
MYKQKLTGGFILLVYILIAAACNSNNRKSGKPENQQEVSVIEVSIGGMMCLGCEQTIQNNVGKLEGIKSVKASFTTGNAMIEYFQGIVDTTKIREAIIGSGYTVKKFIAATKQEGEK